MATGWASKTRQKSRDIRPVIVKGLFYREQKKRLESEYRAVTYSEEGLRDLPREMIDEIQKNVIGPLMAGQIKTIGRDVFSYRAAFSTTHPYVSAWLLVFYGRYEV